MSGTVLKAVQFPVQWGVDHIATMILVVIRADWMTYPKTSKSQNVYSRCQLTHTCIHISSFVFQTHYSTFCYFYFEGIGHPKSSYSSHTNHSHMININPLLNGELKVLEVYIVFYYDWSTHIVKNHMNNLVTIIFVHSICVFM